MEPITIGYTTGKTVQLAVRRDSDGLWLDFSDNTFKAAGWVTPKQAVTELSGAGIPAGVVGEYRATVDPAAWTAGEYQAYILDTAVTSKPVGFSGFSVQSGTITGERGVKAQTDKLAFTNANKVDAAVLAAADFAQAAADKVWSSAARTLTSLGAALVQEIWDQATSALTTAGSIGKRIVDYLTGDAFARLGAPAGASVSADIAAVKTDTAAIKAKTDNLPSGVKKNTALAGFSLAMYDSADGRTPKTGLTVTAQRSLDGAAYANCANAVSEIGTTGRYKIDLAAADLNADVVALKFTASGADPTDVTILTEP